MKEVVFDLATEKGSASIQWLDILKGEWSSGPSLEGGKAVTTTAPGDGHWAMLVDFK